MHGSICTMELQIPRIQRMVCHICGEFLHAACSIKRHFINTERRVVFKMKMVFNAEETPKISLHRWSLNFFQCLISPMMLFHAKVGVLDSSRRLEGAAKNIVTEGFIGANQQTCANIWEVPVKPAVARMRLIIEHFSSGFLALLIHFLLVIYTC